MSSSVPIDTRLMDIFNWLEEPLIKDTGWGLILLSLSPQEIFIITSLHVLQEHKDKGSKQNVKYVKYGIKNKKGVCGRNGDDK